MGDSTRTIQFSVEASGKKLEITRYAREKGFRDASTLARFALYQYMQRYPLKNAKAVQPEPPEGKES